MRELYESDFHKPGIYGSRRVWAIVCDVFPCMTSRVGRGRRAAVDFVVRYGWGGFSFLFFRYFFFFERTRSAASMRPPCLIYLSTSAGVRTRCHYLISLSACVSVCVCVTFVVFTDCESCTKSISTNPESMEAGEYGLTRRTCLANA